MLKEWEKYILKWQLIFYEASQMKWSESFDFPVVKTSGFSMYCKL